MNKLYKVMFGVGVSLGMVACIKDEPQNMEADIVAVHIADSLINGSPIINNNNVAIYVKQDKVNMSEVALMFELTEGASITPASGSIQDYTQPVTFTVTAQDGKHSKQYLVTLVNQSVPTDFGFEYYEFDAAKAYVKFFEPTNNIHQYLWGSGNPGFATLAGSNPTAASYPTQVTTESQEVYTGSAALKLVTTFTGSLGALVEMPIAAGSLFIGSLDVSNQFNPVTLMGLPFNKVPTFLEGYYKYKPGPTLTDKNSNVLSGSDECAIYAVLYDRIALQRDKQVSWLTNNNAQTDENIVAIAKLPSGAATIGNDFVHFRIPFEFKGEIDRAGIEAFNYNIAIVFSSSKEGDIYQGAVGSTLIVDHVQIITTP